MLFWIVMFAIGAVQAAMLSLALWRRQANPWANRVLAVWLAIIAAHLALLAAHLAAPGAGLHNAVQIARVLPFLYVSLFFVYVRALTTGRGFSSADLVHAGGFLLALAWVLWSLAAGATTARETHWTSRWFDPLLFVWAAAYLAAALALVYRYRQAQRQRRSDGDRTALGWVVLMAASQLLIWGIAAAHALLDLPYVDYLLIYVAVAGWVCLVGWCSLAQPPVVAVPARHDVDPPSMPAYDPRMASVEARLSQLMSVDALYREPALTIAQLARRSGYPEYLVSAVINRRFGGNFWDYVNRCRIEAIRACLANPDDERTILEIAYDGGFTAKSTFNASFKRILGETPSAYRRRLAGDAATARRIPSD